MIANGKTVLVVDFGTQSVRASIIDQRGNIIKMVKNKYERPYLSPRPGWCEQDPNYYYEKMKICTKTLRSEVPELMEQVEAMTLTTFRDSPVFLDRDYRIVRPTILWLDQRRARLEQKLHWYQNLLFSVIGMGPAIRHNRERTPAHWIRENEPENWARIAYYVPLSTYFNLCLTGELADSPSNCTGHFPLNFKKGRWYGWNALKGNIYAVGVNQLPRLCPSGSVIGRITAEASRETGIKEGLRLLTSGSDKSCESLGNGCLQSSELSLSYGTACTVEVTSKRYREPETFLPGYQACYPGHYNLEVQIYRGYWMLTWFAKEFAPEAIDEAAIQHMTVEEVLNRSLLDIKPGCGGLITQPYWGPGLKRPLAKGAMIGFNDFHTKYHLYRSIIEGIAFALRDGFDEIRHRTHRKGRIISVSGGGAASDAICQITADIFGLPVRKVQTTETSSLGAAMASFMALGVYRTAEEAKSQMVRYVKTYEPDPASVRAYDDLYRHVYRKIYPNLRRVYRHLSRYTLKEQ